MLGMTSEALGEFEGDFADVCAEQICPTLSSVQRQRVRTPIGPMLYKTVQCMLD